MSHQGKMETFRNGGGIKKREEQINTFWFYNSDDEMEKNIYSTSNSYLERTRWPVHPHQQNQQH